MRRQNKKICYLHYGCQVTITAHSPRFVCPSSQLWTARIDRGGKHVITMFNFTRAWYAVRCVESYLRAHNGKNL